MKHIILLLWHKNMEQLKNLINLFDEDFTFYIHLDRKSAVSEKEVAELNNLRSNICVYKKYRVNWGGFYILKAELFLLQQIFKNQESFGYVHIFSGQDYPIKNIHEIKRFFEVHKNEEFIEYMRLPSAKWEHGTYDRFNYYRLNDFLDIHTPMGYKYITGFVKLQQSIGYKRRVPRCFNFLYGGSTWMSITSECAKYIIDYHSKNKAFYNRLKYTFASDEVYFHTVILNSPFAKNVRNNNLRCILWKDNGASPVILTEKHWREIITSDCLFARKFDYIYSKRLLDNIDTYILKDECITITSQGYWQDERLEGHLYDNGLARGILSLLSFMQVKTIADFGCGSGCYVALLRNNGYDVEGYDENPTVEKRSALLFTDGFYCQCVDFTEDLEAEEPFDLIISLEIGEHIPFENEDVFLMNLVRNAHNYILLSWAGEEQSGEGCINCHSNNDIILKMKDLGLSFNSPVSSYLRKCATLWRFKNTIMFFEKM